MGTKCALICFCWFVWITWCISVYSLSCEVCYILYIFCVMWVSVLVQSLLRGYENLNCLVFWLFSYKSCSVFFLPSKLVEVYEIWIIVWIWAFFFLFLLTSLGSFHKEKLIWVSKPNLPFWAHKIYMDLF